MIAPKRLAKLEADLNDFHPQVRRAALIELASLVGKGEIPLNVEADVANMHCHTFFSFNAYGYSPASLAWLAKHNGYKLMGTVDFDVLDAVDEFLDACELLGVRGSTGLETRVYIPEFSTREINSPGEPGVAYSMGIGFTCTQAPPAAAPILSDLRQRAMRRNRGVVERVNAYLDPVTIDYDRDVLPLTPSGTATERHIILAYIAAAGRIVPDPVAFWSEKLQSAPEATRSLMADSPKFQNAVRAKLMKRGGVGYVQPTPESFPSLDELHAMITACEALPCAAWLDGSSAGEQPYDELLELMVSKGAVALNIVPDRNWNVPDPEIARMKVQKLYEVVELAEKMALPLNIGTEMNSYGLKLVDDFNAPALAPVRQAFLDGAYFIYGHTILQRALGLGFGSEWAKANLPDRPARNRFYIQAGKLTPPGQRGVQMIKSLHPVMTPEQMLNSLAK
jgi:hypothetical protein